MRQRELGGPPLESRTGHPEHGAASFLLQLLLGPLGRDRHTRYDHIDLVILQRRHEIAEGHLLDFGLHLQGNREGHRQVHVKTHQLAVAVHHRERRLVAGHADLQGLEVDDAIQRIPGHGGRSEQQGAQQCRAE